MFGKKKNKKQPKIEKVFDSSSEEEQASAGENLENTEAGETRSDIDEFLGIDSSAEPEDNLTEEQKEKVDKLNTVKGKISQILQSQNIEIVDENIGDEYESGGVTSDEKSQQDYDSLKALYGDKAKGKKDEVTLTIDDFDYTYTGQYLDEYDLMHMKAIKKIRLQKKYPKGLKKFLIAASIVSVLAVGGVMVYLFTKEKPVYLKTVMLNQTERNYYVDEIFDYTGLYFIAEYSDGSKKTIDLTKEHFTDYVGNKEPAGIDGSDIQFVKAGLTTLTFTYQNVDVDYRVNVLKKEAVGLQAIYSQGVFGLSEGDFLDKNNLDLSIIYDGFGGQQIPLNYGGESAEGEGIAVFVDDVKCSYIANKGYKVESGTTATSKIEIVYTFPVKKEFESFTVTLENGKTLVRYEKPAVQE